MMTKPKTRACKRRKTFLTVSITILIILLCHASVPFAAGSKDSRVLTFGTENEFAGFELLKSGSRLAINGSTAANTIMEPLFRISDDGKLIPVLGLSAVSSEGGKVWTIKLRKGVKFHDGTPFTADAVVHHWDRILNPENKYRGRSALSPILSVDKVNYHTVKFNLKHAWLPFLPSISSTRSLMNLIPSPQAVETGSQNRAPVGTGPFKFEEWQSGEKFVVVRNPEYWQKGKPLLDKIIFKPMTDSQTRFASLKTGQVQIAWMDRGNILKKAEGDPTLQLYRSEDNGAEIFILNTSKVPLDDINVRRALAHANNVDMQVQMVYKNSIPAVHHPLGDDYKCQDDGYLEYSPEKAKKLIETYGQPVEIEILHSSSKRGRDVGELTQQLMKSVGVTAKPIGLKFGPVIKKVIGGDYQVSTWRISSQSDQGPSFFRMFHSKSRANFSRYKNPEMDKLLVAQRMETGPEKRKQLLCKIVRLINQDVPIIYRGGMRHSMIATQNVKGIKQITYGIVPLADAWIE